MGQWERAVGTAPNGRRRVMVTPRPYSLFTQGYQGGSGISRLQLNEDLGVTPNTKIIPIVRAGNPEKDLPLEHRVRTTKITTCPGCGIVPPTGRGTTSQGKINCQNCW